MTDDTITVCVRCEGVASELFADFFRSLFLFSVFCIQILSASQHHQTVVPTPVHNTKTERHHTNHKQNTHKTIYINGILQLEPKKTEILFVPRTFWGGQSKLQNAISLKCVCGAANIVNINAYAVTDYS